MLLNLLLSHRLLLGKCLKYEAVRCISEIHYLQKTSLYDNMRQTFQSKYRAFLTCCKISKSTPTPEIAQDAGHTAEMQLHLTAMLYFERRESLHDNSGFLAFPHVISSYKSQTELPYCFAIRKNQTTKQSFSMGLLKKHK